MTAKQVQYGGRVQGVGFRYTVKRLAGGFEVVGCVRNLEDGSVELQAMAQDEEELEAFLQAIRESSLAGNIKSVVESSIPPLAGVKQFNIA
ncbi:MAG: acylphosphatase [Roseimicrobium sp.]